MGFEQARWVWMNGEMVAWEQATTHVSVHGLHYGTGVFEGIRCYETPRGPAIFRLREHIQRLFCSALVYEIRIPHTAAELESAACELVRRNGFSSCYIRPLCFFGSGSLGLDPSSCPVQTTILAWPWNSFLESETRGGVRVCLSSWRKFHSQMMPTTAKACGQYVNSVLAAQGAKRRGFDEALLFNREGGLAEGSGENLFLVRDGRLLTNDARHSILMGITRDSVIELAAGLGYPTDIGELALEGLYSAEEAFLTGTAVEVAPIGEVEGKRIGKAAPGPVTRAIQKAFRAIVSGHDERYSHWLRPVI